MIKQSLVIFMGVGLFFVSCTKKGEEAVITPPADIEPSSPAYVSKVVYLKNVAQPSATDTLSWSMFTYSTSGNLTLSSFPYNSYTYDSLKRITEVNCFQNVNPTITTNYKIIYDLNGLPLSGVRKYIKPPSKTGNTDDITYIDTIRYWVSNNLVIRASYYNRMTIKTLNNSANPNMLIKDTSYIRDTIDRYVATYEGKNIKNIHSVYLDGKIIDITCSFGSGKGYFPDSHTQFVLMPDQFWAFNYHFAAWHSANELLNLKKVFVTDNNRTEEVTINYAFYPKSLYPLSATVNESGINALFGGNYKLSFIY